MSDHPAIGADPCGRASRQQQGLVLNVGGIVGRYPLVKQGWSGSQVGDFTVGVKLGLLSQAAGKPEALALRGMVKLPTGNKATGVGTGKAAAGAQLQYSTYIGGTKNDVAY